MGILLVSLDLRLALLLHLVDQLEELGLLTADIVHTLLVVVAILSHQLVNWDLHGLSIDLALGVVPVDIDELLVDVEDNLPNLLVSWLVGVELELLGHLGDLVLDVLVVVLILDGEHLSTVSHIVGEADRSVDQIVRVALESLENLLADMLASEDEVVSSMVIVVSRSFSHLLSLSSIWISFLQ